MSVKLKMERVSKRVGDAFTSTPDGETAVLDTLKKEHEEVAGLLDELDKAEGAGERKTLVRKIKGALIPHTKAEQKVVYDALIRLRDKDVQTDGHEGYWEHELASRTLKKLEALTNARSAEHRAVGKVLEELVTHHVKEEERNVWSDVRDHFSVEERCALNRTYEAAKARIVVR
jgi:hypothetical protein